MPTCRKCGAELHEDAKVCVECGTRTPLGGGFDYGEREPWRPTRNQWIAAAAVVFVLIVIMIVKAFQVSPPELVAEQWFDALVNRRVRAAEELVTEKLKQDLANRMTSVLGLSDEYNSEVVQNDATYTMEKPDAGKNAKTADVTITIQYADGDTHQVVVSLVRKGRKWQVDGVT